MVGADQHPRGMRDHQADEADRPAHRDDRSGDGRGDEEELLAQSSGIDPERGGGLVPHGEGVQTPCRPAEVCEADENGTGGDRHGRPVGSAQAAEQPHHRGAGRFPRSAANTMNVVTAEKP